MTFYFNPEYDILQLGFIPPAQQSLVDFLHDIRACDPQGQGLLNLAMDINGVRSLRGMGKISVALAERCFISTLSQLREIIWMADSIAGRAILPMTGFDGVKVQFNHSMPLKAAPPAFDILGLDHRSIGPDLKFVLTARSDPRRASSIWADIVKKWGIRPERPARQRVLFARTADVIRDIASAARYLKEEEENWLKSQQRPSRVYHQVKMFNKMEPPVETLEERENAVRPAVGFWLFPVEALGSLDDDLRGMKKVFDLSGHWPELALSHLC